MIRGYLLLALLSLLFLIACEKVELPPPEQDGIPFSMKGIINGEEIEFGLDHSDYQMHSFSQYSETDSIWKFSGRLGPESEAEGPALQLEFRYKNKGRTLGAGQEITGFFNKPQWSFFQPMGLERKLFPLSINIDLPPNLTLNRITSPKLPSFSSDQPQAHFNPEELGDFPLCVEYEDRMGLKGKFCSEIPANNSGFTPVANWRIRNQMGDSAELQGFISKPLINSAYSYKWNDDFTNNNQYTATEPATYTFTARDDDGRLYSHEKQLLWRPIEEEYYTYGHNVEIQSMWKPPNTVIDRIQKGTVNITYFDSDMREWVFDSQQEENISFEIIERQKYKRNERGEPTLAIKVKISCTLVDENNRKITIRDLQGWFAVGLPPE